MTIAAAAQDFEATLKAKSDQMNAADLLDKEPIIVTIAPGTKVKPSDDQPMTIMLVDRLAYRPCKNMRRVLKAAWGLDYPTWTGRMIEIFCDPEAKYGKIKTGGLRISGLSHIPDEGITVTVQWRRGEISIWKVRCIKAEAPWIFGQIHPSWEADSTQFIADVQAIGCTVEQVDQFLLAAAGADFRKWWNDGECNGIACSWVPSRWRAGLLVALKKKPELVAKIAALQQGN